MSLTGKQRRFLRAQGHHLSAVLQIGKEGLSEAFVSAVDQALLDHELIKVRIGGNAPLERDEAADELAGATGGEIAQVLGNTVLLYRPHPDEPVIVLP
jgi:RNA-binding protein